MGRCSRGKPWASMISVGFLESLRLGIYENTSPRGSRPRAILRGPNGPKKSPLSALPNNGGGCMRRLCSTIGLAVMVSTVHAVECGALVTHSRLSELQRSLNVADSV